MGLAALIGLFSFAAGAPVPSPWGEFVSIGGRQVHLRCEGVGPATVLLIHGTPRFSFHFALLMPEVARYARVCAYDRAGDAWSDALPRGLPDARFFIDELDRVGRHLSPDRPVILAGHSIGGVLAQAYASAHPERVAALVLIDAVAVAAPPRPSGRPPARGSLDIPASRVPASLRAANHWATAKWYDYAEQVPSAAAIQYQTNLFALASQAAARLGAIPVWFVARDFGMESQRREARRWKQAVLLEAGPVSHDIQLDRPDVVAAAIVQALKATGGL